MNDDSRPYSDLTIDLLRGENTRLHQSNLQLQQDVEELHQTSTAEEQAYLTTVHELQEYLSSLHAQLDERERKKKEMEERKATIHSLEARATEGEIIRRRLHNTLQELRGNLRVIARVRPILENENTSSLEPAVWTEGDDGVCVRYKDRVQRFTFDGAFGFTSSQSDVFDEVSNFVQSALDGYNVCLFTYGQTGSGKTFTMQGMGDGEYRGIVPRSIEKIMEDVHRLREVGWEYSVSVSFVEIYRELLRDLLAREPAKRGRLDVKLDGDGHPYIPNVTKLTVETPGHIHSLMSIASSCRAVGVWIENHSEL